MTWCTHCRGQSICCKVRVLVEKQQNPVSNQLCSSGFWWHCICCTDYCCFPCDEEEQHANLIIIILSNNCCRPKPPTGCPSERAWRGEGDTAVSEMHRDHFSRRILVSSEGIHTLFNVHFQQHVCSVTSQPIWLAVAQHWLSDSSKTTVQSFLIHFATSSSMLALLRSFSPRIVIELCEIVLGCVSAYGYLPETLFDQWSGKTYLQCFWHKIAK